MLIKKINDYLLPDWQMSDLRQTNWPKLYQRGIKVALLDLDNTLAPHGSNSGDDYSRAVIEAVKQAGIVPVLLTNAKDDRGQQFARSSGMAFEGSAGKPGTKGIERIKQRYDVTSREIVLVGDQIFTDVWAGKRAGVYVLKVEQLSRSEIITVKLKRILERLLIRKSLYNNLEDISLTKDSI